MICESLYKGIIETIKPKNEIIFESLIYQVDENEMDIFNIILLKTYLEKYNFLKYEKRKINNYNEMIQYLNKNKKIYDNVFRIIIFDSLKESEIKFRIENEQYFSFMLDNKDFEKNSMILKKNLNK